MRCEFNIDPFKADQIKSNTSERFDGESAEKFLYQQNFMLMKIYTKKEETQFKV